VAAALAAAATLLNASHAAAQSESVLEPVTVIGSRVETRVLDAPYAIGVVTADELRAGGAMVNLSEALARVPGLVINNRSNYAQDLQISSRGFGARSTFGVRGMRLYTDGIPATMPDGSGVVTHFDLAGAERVEVLRGPFSALYGNSSGGVIALTGATPKTARVELAADAGSFGARQLRASVGAPLEAGWNGQAQLSHFEIDGFRPHSAAKRDLANVRFNKLGERDRVTLIFNSIDQPADDPLGLTRTDFDANPYQTIRQATDFNTRKLATQSQVGANWSHTFGGVLAASELTVYVGERAVTQWQAIPELTQRNPTPPPVTTRHPGGVIDFDRAYSGVDARLLWRWSGAQLVTGVNFERQADDRRGYENFIGDPRAPTERGVTGEPRRDETNRARSADAYAQGEVELGSALSATLGVRTGSVHFDANDRYIKSGNGDDSGSRDFSYTNPVAALSWRVAPGLRLYVSAGRGFESPTLNELAYRADGSSGFNDKLKAQTSRQVEIGTKWRGLDNRLALDVALFDARTSDEIGVLTNAGGRSTFQNVGRTKRLGAEASLRWQMTQTLRAMVAVTRLEATYLDSFQTCTGVPCNDANPQNRRTAPAGNRIAGTNRGSGFAELAWQPRDATEFAAEMRAQGH